MHITNQKPVVLVTGSSRGIGRAIALQFAKNHYHVILNCSTSLKQLENVKKEILALPDGSCTCCRCDVSDSSQVTAMFEDISATCGQIDVLINNAGISHIGLFTDMTDDLWNRMIQTNLSSVFYCSRATLPSMISRKKGKIINIFYIMNFYTNSHVGNGRRLLRSRLFRRKIRHPRTDEGTGKRACT